MTAFSSSKRSLTISHSSSKDLKAKRKPPAVKKPLPPRQASGAFSSTSTRAPCSWADRAAHIPALPPPTTITSYGSLMAALSIGGGRRGPLRSLPRNQDCAGEAGARTDGSQHHSLLLA